MEMRSMARLRHPYNDNNTGVKCGGRLCWIGAFSHSATPCKQRGRIRTCGVRWDSSIEGTPTYDTQYGDTISSEFQTGQQTLATRSCPTNSGVVPAGTTSGVEPATRPIWWRSKAGLRHPLEDQQEKAAGVKSAKRRPKPFCSTRLSYRFYAY